MKAKNRLVTLCSILVWFLLFLPTVRPEESKSESNNQPQTTPNIDKSLLKADFDQSQSGLQETHQKSAGRTTIYASKLTSASVSSGSGSRSTGSVGTMPTSVRASGVGSGGSSGAGGGGTGGSAGTRPASVRTGSGGGGSSGGGGGVGRGGNSRILPKSGGLSGGGGSGGGGGGSSGGGGGRSGGGGGAGRAPSSVNKMRNASPRIDPQIKDLGNAYEIRVEIKGVSTSTCRVETTENMMTISGQRAEITETKSTDASFSSSTSQASFNHSFSLPGPVDSSTLKKECKDSTLIITVSKKT